MESPKRRVYLFVQILRPTGKVPHLVRLYAVEKMLPIWSREWVLRGAVTLTHYIGDIFEDIKRTHREYDVHLIDPTGRDWMQIESWLHEIYPVEFYQELGDLFSGFVSND